jgi:hypothetical protein
VKLAYVQNWDILICRGPFHGNRGAMDSLGRIARLPELDLMESQKENVQ